MDILSPLSSADEVADLLAAGATEFYCGITPAGWSRLEPDASLNCKGAVGFTDLPDLAALDRARSEIQAAGARVFVLFNARSFLLGQLLEVGRVATTLQQLGVDAVIVSDVGLLCHLAEHHPDLEVHLSTVTGVFNSEAVAFFLELGVSRVVLPDHLNLDEVARLGRTHGPSLEIFVKNNRCKNIESVCGFEHYLDDAPQRAGAPAGTSSRFKEPLLEVLPASVQRRVLSSTLVERLVTREHRHGCRLNYRVEPEDPTVPVDERIAGSFGLYNAFCRRSQCGACGMHSAADAGIGRVKIDGRYLPRERKVQDVAFVRRCADALGQPRSRAAFVQHCRSAHRTVYGRPCRVEQCYYPELWT